MDVPTADPAPLPETPDLQGAYPRLSDEQVQILSAHGERRATRPGEILYRTGDENYDFFVVLAGTVAVVEQEDGGAERVVAVHGPGRFLGELSLLCDQAALLTAVVHEPGQVLAVPVERLRELVSQDPALGDLVLRAYLLRRSILIELGVGLRIIGSRFSSDTKRLLEFAARNLVPHRWIDLERDREAEELLSQLGVKPEDTPVVIWRGEQVLRNPSNPELARSIGLLDPSSGSISCDLVVVGAGPAGLAAAVYGASEGLTTVVLDGVATGGQAGTSSRIENYLGFPSGISGSELAGRAVIQAEKFGARINVPAEAIALERRDGHHVVKLDGGSSIAARTVIIATGARYRRLDLPRMEQFEETSVYYAATQVEARVCRNDPVAVVGGGNSAGQATVFLAQHAARVWLVVREDALGRNMSRYLVDRIERLGNVEVLCDTEVRELRGDDTLEALVVENNRTGERRTLAARAMFVFIGVQPHARWLADQLALDDNGYIRTGADAASPNTAGQAGQTGRQPLPLETSQSGVFAAGDVRSGSVKRVASAVGEGAMAVRLVHDHLQQVGGSGQ
ncbi:MAG: FAD-dependent oxidoreductase [Acidimicrobiales bacterium]